MADLSIGRLAPRYDLTPEGGVALYDGHATVTVDTRTADAAVRIWFDWERAVRVTATGNGPLARALVANQSPASIAVPDLGEVQIDILDSSTSMPANDWTIEAVAVDDAGDRDAPLDHVAFQIANFTVYSNGGTDGARWRLTLSDDRWDVLIDQLPDAPDRLKLLKLAGGGAVTHAARLRSGDGSPFTWAEAVEQLYGLQILLSFVAGDRVPVLLPVGYSPSGDAVAHGLRSPHRESYHGRFRWCGSNLVGAVSGLWSRYLDMWEEDSTRRLWQIAGELYVEAQHGDNLETRLADAQNLLEVLAWDRLVRVRGLDPVDVDNRTAHWRFRKMLDDIGVPVRVPTTLPDARQEWPGSDGPKIISELRNSIVHPTDLEALLRMSAPTKHEVFRLAMWYSDLALLRLLDYDGPHVNRTGTLPIWEGLGKPVPWSQASSSP